MGTLVDSGLVWPIYNKLINDWIFGDDREWSGSFPITLLLGSDTGLTDAYLTIKRDPTQVDADALVQIHVTTVASTYGSIVNSGGNSTIVIRVIGSDLVDGGIVPGPYYYDIRGIATPSLAVWTFESGQIDFVQNVTGVEAAGVPAALPNSGNPTFRGMVCGGPPIVGTYNYGDWVVNACPVAGAPWGWTCSGAGQGAQATWLSIGIIGDNSGV